MAYSKVSGCDGFWMDGVETYDSWVCSPPDYTTTVSWCEPVSEPILFRAGDCAGVSYPPGSRAYIEHWGLPGVAYQHAFADGTYTHDCQGPRCRPLNPVVLDPDAFTPEIDQCFCEWGERTSPPPDTSGVPFWCGGQDTQPFPQADTGLSLGVRDLVAVPAIGPR